MRVYFKTGFVLTLLGLLLSYSLDLECFLESGEVCAQICQEAAEDICAEPALGSPPPALPSRLFTFVALLPESREVVFTPHSRGAKPSPRRFLSVGLRAPPAAV